MSESSEFEQKIARLKPRIFRNVASEILVSCDTPEIFPLSNRKKSFQQIKPYFKVGVACFLLGAVMMYVILTCFFDHQPPKSRPLIAQSQTVVIPVKIDETELTSIRSPLDLRLMMNRKTVKTLKNQHPTPDYTQSRLIREFLQ